MDSVSVFTRTAERSGKSPDGVEKAVDGSESTGLVPGAAAPTVGTICGLHFGNACAAVAGAPFETGGAVSPGSAVNARLPPSPRYTSERMSFISSVS